MSQTSVSAPQQQVNMPAVDLRQYVGGLLSSEGVHLVSDLQVSQRGAGANMSVDVAAGACYILDDHGSGGGYYGYTLAATQNLAIAAADPSNPRVDRIVVQVDDQYLGDGDNVFGAKVLKGTATGGATLANCTGAASVPGSALLLANVLVDAAAVSIVTAKIDSTGASNNSPAVRPIMSLAGVGLTRIADSGELGAAAATIDFQSIPSTYSSLLLVCYLRGDTAALKIAGSLRFNNDSTAIYDEVALLGTSASEAYAQTAAHFATDALPAGTAPADSYGMAEILVPYYKQSSHHKTFRSNWSGKYGTSAGLTAIGHVSGFWRSTAAVTRVTLIPSAGNWDVGSRVMLYGLL